MFSMQIIYFMFYGKGLEKQQCLRPHDKYFLFRMFFSQVNNKQFFVDDPLKIVV